MSSSEKPSSSTQPIDLSIERLRGSLAQLGARSFTSFQYLMDLSSLLLSGSAQTSERDFEAFRSAVRFMPSSQTALTFERAKFESGRWLAKNFLSEGLRVVSTLLEDIRTLCALAELGGADGQPATAHNEQIARITGDDRGEFLRRPIPDRLAALEDRYRIRTPLAPALVSLTLAVQCLRFRGGVVGKADTNEKDALVLALVSMQVVQAEQETSSKRARASGGSAADPKPKGPSVKLSQTKKKIPVGQPIEINKSELMAAILTLCVSVSTLLQSAEVRLKEGGTEAGSAKADA